MAVARLRISLSENVIVNLDASFRPGESGAVTAEVEGGGVFSLLKKDMPCEVDDRPGVISGIQRNGKKRVLTVRLRPETRGLTSRPAGVPGFRTGP